jgi:hypothetical protein
MNLESNNFMRLLKEEKSRDDEELSRDSDITSLRRDVV